MAGKIKKIVISDLHLSDGQREGELNPWENFYHDDKLAEFLRYYSTDYYEDEEVELIINGDFFDLLQVRYDGGFPTEVTERIAVAKLKACLDGHPIVVAAMRQFVDTPHKRIVVLPGNHDMELCFAGCQRLLTERVCGDPNDPRVFFVTDRSFYEFDGVQVHHGMQFEAMNRIPWDRIFVHRGLEEPILYQPFGSLFLLRVLNVLKGERPYIDRVQPFKLYFLGALVFDTGIALRLLGMALMVFWQYRLRPLLQGRVNKARIRASLDGFLEYSAFPNFERKVRRIMRRNPRVHTVIIGHTHLRKVRRFGHHKTYINTGTWTDLISLDIANLGMSRELCYATIEYFEDADQPPQATLRAWQGYRDLWRDIPY